MTDYTLETEQASAHYDPETRIARIAYRGYLSSDVTVEVYAWLEYLYRTLGAEGFYGQIFDFRQVEAFEPSNIKTARRVSNRINMIIDTSRIPVSLLVGDFYHEQMLLSAMRVSPENVRKKIVWTEEEALAFLAEKHAEWAAEEKEES